MQQASTLATTGIVARWTAALFGMFALLVAAAPMAAAAEFQQPMNSSPISVSADQRLVWVVNPLDDTVSVLRTDTNVVIATIATGDEPRSVALDEENTYAFVANAASSNVTVIRILNDSVTNFQAVIERTLKTGAEPWNIVISTDGNRVFVANSGQDTITVINAITRTIIGQINIGNSVCNDPDRNRRFQPRGMAVTSNNSFLYVTRFLSFARSVGGKQGLDGGKQAAVCQISINTSSNLIGSFAPVQAVFFSQQITGFRVDSPGPGNTLGDGVSDATFAFPNQLQSLVIRGNRGFMPNIAASPTSPLVFNTSTQAFVTFLNNVGTGTLTDGGGLNLHLGAKNPEPGKKTLFFSNPWAIAFTSQVNVGSAYVVSAGSDLLVKLRVNASDALAFTVDADTTRYIDLNDPLNAATRGANAGKNPQGIAIAETANGQRAYVTNQVSGNVSIVNTEVAQVTSDKVIKVVQTALVPPSGSLEEQLRVGAEMFFSSRGHFNRPAGTSVSTEERLSSDGWQNCASCHFNGWTDGVIWQFGSGPRKSVNLAGSFNPRNRNQQKILNYSAIFDEVEDFEANIRNVSGPGNLPAAVACETGTGTSLFNPDQGLIFGDNGDIDKPPCIVNQFVKPNANRREHTVDPVGATASVKALTALKQWVRFAIRVPNGPLNCSEITGNGCVPFPDIFVGRSLFGQQCASCHKGGLWSISAKNFVSPPAGAQIACERDLAAGAPPLSFCTNDQDFGNPVATQSLRAFLRNVNSFNLGVAGGGNAIGNNIGAGEFANSALVGGFAQPRQDALGRDYNGDGFGIGYSPQSLLGVHMVQPFMHNGACETLVCVIGDVEHRTGNFTITDFLNTAAKREQVRRFVESIDAATTPFP